MAIVHMAAATTDIPAGARKIQSFTTENGHPILTYETHEGLCLQEREYNGRDDSDFSMLVWEPALGQPRQIAFASTRGWCSPCFGSRVDATAEVRAAYAAWEQQQQVARRADAAWRADLEAMVAVTTGREVQVVRGRKVAVGTEGVVVWMGEGRFGTRVGLRDAGGVTHFTAVGNVEAII